MTSNTVYRPLLTGMQLAPFRPYTCMPAPIWVPAPYVDRELSGGIQGVWIAENEEVKWTKQYYPDGTMSIIGYTIITKPIVVSNAFNIEE